MQDHLTRDWPFDQDDDAGDERIRLVPQPESMTRSAAEAQLATRRCDYCGQAGMEIRVEPNNNGLHVACPHCGQRHAWRGVTWLRHRDGAKRRRPVPAAFALETVWPDADTRCILCDRTRAELAVLAIGLNCHHTPRYAVVAHDGRGLPLCVECHELVNWRQRLVDRERATLQGEPL